VGTDSDVPIVNVGTLGIAFVITSCDIRWKYGNMFIMMQNKKRMKYITPRRKLLLVLRIAGRQVENTKTWTSSQRYGCGSGGKYTIAEERCKYNRKKLPIIS
jgi:hypothetical protein